MATKRDCGHTCNCQSPIETRQSNGIAIWTDAPTAIPRIRAAFEPIEGEEGLFRASGEGFIQRVRDAIEPLSHFERESVRAVAIDANGRFEPWTSAPVEELLTRLETPWLADLLNNERFRYHIQPIVEAGSLDVHGFETLVRADEPYTDKSPWDMIQAAKAHNALLKFDQIVRAGAIREAFPRLIEGEKQFINFFPKTIYDPNVCLRTTMQAAESIGADLSRLVFEVVESEQFPDIANLRSILDAYREAGAGVALDDLGAGNTSISYIDELEPDYVKIDKHITEQAVEAGRESILRGIVEHAKDKGIRVIAEGVETETGLETMRRIGVDLIQGWLIAKPAEQPQRDFVRNIARAA